MPKRQITDAERAEFRAAVAGIQPLRAAPRVEPEPPARRRPAPRRQPAPSTAAVQVDSTHSEPIWFARENAGADGRSLQAGHLEPDDAIDLHRLYEDDARRKLLDFLAASVAGHRRCVRIITGKGKRSGIVGPVLRGMCIDMLKADRRVRAFCTPPAHGGGSGALDVLLIM